MKNRKDLVPGIKFINNSEIYVVLWAPNATDVGLVLESGKSFDLQKQARGYHTLITDKLKPGDLYKFRLDGKKGLPDPASRSQPQGVHGYSEIVKLELPIQAQPGITLADYIIYELHTGTFTPGGDFSGVVTKLKYLKELGVNAIEIMPVAQFPGERNWGYDGVFPYAVQSSYGGPQGLADLVDACHKEGLAVILDVVYNHVGPEGNYFNEFGPYFTDKYHTPWGNAINFDDAGSDEVRKYIIENVLMWFRDFKIDALRLDAVHAIKDFGPKHILHEIRERVDELMAETGNKHYLIIEFDLNDNRFINPLMQNGFGMDAQWIDEFHHALRVTAGGDKIGYYTEFEGIKHLAKAYQDAYVYDGVYSESRQKTFGTKADNPGEQFVVFTQNHDHVGNRMLGERTSNLFSVDMQKLMAAAVMVSPYLPMVFMGEEYGEQNPFLYFVSHTDKELIKAVRDGRRNEFKAFHAEGEAPDPQSSETFKRSKLNWDNLTDADHHQMLDYYKQLIALRKSTPALKNNNRKQLEVSCDEDKEMLQLHRWQDEQHVYCFMNFSKTEQTFEPPAGSTIIFSSSSAGQQPKIIKPESIIIYAKDHV